MVDRLAQVAATVSVLVGELGVKMAHGEVVVSVRPVDLFGAGLVRGALSKRR